MGPIIPLLVIVVMMLALVRGATIALASTGMSRESARFQAVSALTGAGFTTTESEAVVQHPHRRHVIFMLMLLGGFGMVTGMSSLILSFVDVTSNPERVWSRVALFAGAMFLVWLSTRVPAIDRMVNDLILWLFRVCLKISSSNHLRIVPLGAHHGIYEVQMAPGGHVGGISIGLIEEKFGLKLLGFFREDGSYVSDIGGDTVLAESTRIVVYGEVERIKSIAVQPL